MVEIVNTLQGLFNPNILVENTFLFSILSIFLAMYGPRLHIGLPPTIRGLFNNAVFRGVVLFLVAYMSHKDFVGALTISIIFVVTMNILQSTEILGKLGNVVSNVVTTEGFSANGPPVANCNTYADHDAQKQGTVYYPLNDSQNSEDMRGGNKGVEHLSSTLTFGQ